VPNPHKESSCETTYAECPHELKTDKCKLLPSMFAPEEEEIRGAMTHCRRFLPHVMNTGGFFVVIFEKVAAFGMSAKSRRAADNQKRRENRESREMTLEKASEGESACASGEVLQEHVDPSSTQAEPTVEAPVADVEEISGVAEVARDRVAEELGQRKKGEGGPRLQRFLPREGLFLDQRGDVDWPAIKEFYGFDDAITSRVVSWRGGKKSDVKLWLVSERAALFLRGEVRLPVRTVQAGVPFLVESSSHHVDAFSWQLVQDGLATLVELGLRRRLTVGMEFMAKLLVDRCVPLTDISTLPDVENLKDSTGALRLGSVAVVLEGSTGGPFLAVAANIAEDSLETTIKPADATSLLKDLEGQPSVDSILGGTVKLNTADGSVEEHEEAEHDAEQT